VTVRAPACLAARRLISIAPAPFSRARACAAPQDKAALIAAMDPRDVARLLAAMPPDEAVVLLSALGERDGALVCEALAPEERRKLAQARGCWDERGRGAPSRPRLAGGLNRVTAPGTTIPLGGCAPSTGRRRPANAARRAAPPQSQALQRADAAPAKKAKGPRPQRGRTPRDRADVEEAASRLESAYEVRNPLVWAAPGVATQVARCRGSPAGPRRRRESGSAVKR
jgi:hypothetical protein